MNICRNIAVLATLFSVFMLASASWARPGLEILGDIQGLEKAREHALIKLFDQRFNKTRGQVGQDWEDANWAEWNEFDQNLKDLDRETKFYVVYKYLIDQFRLHPKQAEFAETIDGKLRTFRSIEYDSEALRQHVLEAIAQSYGDNVKQEVLAKNNSMEELIREMIGSADDGPGYLSMLRGQRIELGLNYAQKILGPKYVNKVLEREAKLMAKSPERKEMDKILAEESVRKLDYNALKSGLYDFKRFFRRMDFLIFVDKNSLAPESAASTYWKLVPEITEDALKTLGIEFMKLMRAIGVAVMTDEPTAAHVEQLEKLLFGDENVIARKLDFISKIDLATLGLKSAISKEYSAYVESMKKLAALKKERYALSTNEIAQKKAKRITKMEAACTRILRAILFTTFTDRRANAVRYKHLLDNLFSKYNPNNAILLEGQKTGKTLASIQASDSEKALLDTPFIDLKKASSLNYPELKKILYGDWGKAFDAVDDLIFIVNDKEDTILKQFLALFVVIMREIYEGTLIKSDTGAAVASLKKLVKGVGRSAFPGITWRKTGTGYGEYYTAMVNLDGLKTDRYRPEAETYPVSKAKVERIEKMGAEFDKILMMTEYAKTQSRSVNKAYLAKLLNNLFSKHNPDNAILLAGKSTGEYLSWVRTESEAAKVLLDVPFVPN